MSETDPLDRHLPGGYKVMKSGQVSCTWDPQEDLVNHPSHYTSHPSGVECITITEHMCFNLGNALKYLWRADLKGKGEEDLRKAMWYIQRELDK